MKKYKKKKTASGRKQPISEKDLNIIRNLSENQIQELFRRSHRNCLLYTSDAADE